MCVEFGEVTVIIGLVINFLAFRLTIVRISWHLNLSDYFACCAMWAFILFMKNFNEIETLFLDGKFLGPIT